MFEEFDILILKLHERIKSSMSTYINFLERRIKLGWGCRACLIDKGICNKATITEKKLKRPVLEQEQRNQWHWREN